MKCLNFLLDSFTPGLVVGRATEIIYDEEESKEATTTALPSNFLSARLMDFLILGRSRVSNTARTCSPGLRNKNTTTEDSRFAFFEAVNRAGI